MRTSALFDTKKFGFFEIYGVSAWTKGVEPMWTFCRQGGRRSIFLDFVRTSMVGRRYLCPGTLMSVFLRPRTGYDVSFEWLVLHCYPASTRKYKRCIYNTRKYSFHESPTDGPHPKVQRSEIKDGWAKDVMPRSSDSGQSESEKASSDAARINSPSAQLFNIRVSVTYWYWQHRQNVQSRYTTSTALRLFLVV